MSKSKKVLYLGVPGAVCDFLCRREVTTVIDSLTPIEKDLAEKYDYLISFGYKRILPEEILSLFDRRAINLHISLLPLNAGYHPNLWAFADGVSSGVTIHVMDNGIDTGPILIQKEIEFNPEMETLRTSYNRLCFEVQDLFIKNWESLKAGMPAPVAQTNIMRRRTFHLAKDLNRLKHLLTDGWDTPASVLDSYAADVQMSRQYHERIPGRD